MLVFEETYLLSDEELLKELEKFNNKFKELGSFAKRLNKKEEQYLCDLLNEKQHRGLK